MFDMRRHMYIDLQKWNKIIQSHRDSIVYLPILVAKDRIEEGESIDCDLYLQKFKSMSVFWVHVRQWLCHRVRVPVTAEIRWYVRLQLCIDLFFGNY